MQALINIPRVNSESKEKGQTQYPLGVYNLIRWTRESPSLGFANNNSIMELSNVFKVFIFYTCSELNCITHLCRMEFPYVMN